MAGNKKVAVVILGWNGKKFLEQFLPGVCAHTPADSCEIIVADNGSTDGSVEYVAAHYPQIRVIQNSRNGGYAGGYNDALQHVHAQYYVLLNQDVEVTPTWIESITAAMDADPNIAAAQPKIKAYHQRTHFEYAGAAGGYVDALGYAYCRGRLFDTLEEDTGQYNTPADIFWATGACLFIRADAYWAAGGLDEDFFAHQEEVDLCWRLKSMGHRIVCIPQSVVYHVGGGSLPQGNPRKTYLNFRNNLMMLFKNLPTAELWWKLPLRLHLDGIAALQSLLGGGGWQGLWAILKAQLHFIMALPSLIKKRRGVPAWSGKHLTPISVVWQYFVKGRKLYSQLKK